jgi:glycosyltransferase involved in cell wall biosynthesis
MLLMLKILRKPLVITVHSALPLAEINKNFTKENRINGSPVILKIGLLLVTKLIGSFASKLIVHEAIIKERLSTQYRIKPQKVEVIPLGIENLQPIAKTLAKSELKALDKRVLLYVGYITGYKGIETLIEGFNLLRDKDNYILLVVGGEPSITEFNESYRAYVTKIKKRASEISKTLFSLVCSSKILIIFPEQI